MKTKFKYVAQLVMVTALLIVFISLYFDCTKSKTLPPTNGTAVSMENTAFSPNSITVPVNTTITWTNKDGFAHTVTSDSSLFDSGIINGGGTFTFTFSTAGTYNYHCNIHTNMTAKVIVQ